MKKKRKNSKRIIERDKLDRVFSKFIRLRDSDDNGYCYCITCGEPVNWKYECDAGHFVVRGKLIHRFNEKNVHAQCKSCNNKDWNQGEQYLHGKAIDEKYGEGTADELMQTRNTFIKMSQHDFESLRLKYQIKVDDLRKEKGL